MCLKTSNGEKSNLLAYVCFCACEKKTIEQSLQWKCTKKKKKIEKALQWKCTKNTDVSTTWFI